MGLYGAMGLLSRSLAESLECLWTYVLTSDQESGPAGGRLAEGLPAVGRAGALSLTILGVEGLVRKERSTLGLTPRNIWNEKKSGCSRGHKWL